MLLTNCRKIVLFCRQIVNPVFTNKRSCLGSGEGLPEVRGSPLPDTPGEASAARGAARPGDFRGLCSFF